MLGTGAGGLAAAVTGASEGLSTLVLEKTELLGGTTAYSAGTCWIPDNRFQRADGVTDDVPVASRYLDALVGDRAPRELREAYLTRGPEMIDYFDGLGVRFWHSKKVVDYHPEIPGAGLGGRALEPQTFDGRTLGKEDFGRVRRPVPEFALFGGTLMVRRAEVNELLDDLQGSRARARRAHRAAARRAVGGRPAALPARHPAGHGQRARREPVRTGSGRAGAGSGSPPPPPSWSPRTGGSSAPSSPTRAGSCGSARAAAWCSRAAGSPRAPSGGPLPALARRRSTPARREGATGDDAARSPRPSAARWGSPATTTRSGSPAPSAAAATASTAVFPHIWDRAKPGIVAVDAGGPPVRRRVGVLPPVHPRHVRLAQGGADDPGLARDRRRGAAPLRAGHGPPAHAGAVLRKYLEAGYLHRGRDGAGAGRVDRRGPRRPRPPPSPPPTGPPRTGVDEEFGKGHERVRPPVRRSRAPAQRQPRPDRDRAVLRDRRSSRPRWAPRSGCAPTRRPGCSTRRARRSRACTRAATTRSR